LLRLAQSRGQAALLYARLADQRRDSRLGARARDLASQSAAVMAEMKEAQLDSWPREERDQVRVLATP
jgi:hypothetical protein